MSQPKFRVAKTNPLRQGRQRGFTLFELVLSVTMLGLISLSLSPAMKAFMTARDRAYYERQNLINNRIAKAMLDYAEQATVTGTLPSNYNSTTNKIFFGVALTTSTATTALMPYLTQQGVPSQETNDDGTAGARVRVYQKYSSGLTQSTPMFGQSGPLADLSYEIAAVYMTDCSRTDTCNTTASSSAPPKGNRITGATWTAGVNDIGMVMFSSLPLQRKMLDLTASRMDRVRDALSTYFKAKVAAASASDTTNWYPSPSDTSPYAGMLVQDPSTNGGCHTVWFDLSAANVDVLAQVSMSSLELGTTPWGGRIEYCRDYDPAATGLSGSNTPPHYAALRINKLVAGGAGLPPDTATSTQNVVVSF